jgi:hypothetical protein
MSPTACVMSKSNRKLQTLIYRFLCARFGWPVFAPAEATDAASAQRAAPGRAIGSSAWRPASGQLASVGQNS